MNRYFCLCLIFCIPCSLHAANDKAGAVKGVIIDIETRETVPFVYLHIEQINRSATTDKEGKFEFNNIPPGNYTLVMHRIGFVSQNRSFTVEDDQTVELQIELRPTILTGRAVEVTGLSEDVRGSNLEHASQKITGNELRRNLGTTLSETISNQPGIDQRSMGAAPARPVIRGLGDSRVLILQDGERTGDVSAMSADHAVTIDPMGANEIEIARGPAALAYGSNAIGGVINVVRNQIATSVPSSLTGAASLQGSSVNTGISGGALVTAPFGNYVLNADINGRYGTDYNTPGGRIDNTWLRTANSTVGLSRIRPWGYTGLAVSTYLSDYGIPPDPDGGHPNGVDIEMRKFQVESRTERIIKDHFFKLLEVQAAYRYYNHKEFESSTIIGTEFISNSANFTLKTRHQGVGFLDDGIIGLWGEFEDYVVLDRFNLEANSYSASLFTIQEADFGPLHVELGLRFDLNTVVPKQERPNARIGHIRQRNFAALATSASLIYDLGRGFYAGAVFLHSFRPPTIDELYSEGPHIAAYSFEIGNPDLRAERGLGKELFLRYSGNRGSVRTAVYHNDFRNYIYPRNTGNPNIFFADLNDYQFVSVDAEMYGFETAAELQIGGRLVANASASFTFAERSVDEDEQNQTGFDGDKAPLPMIPPFNAGFGITWAGDGFNFGPKVRYSAAQNRLGEFETPTDSYLIFDFSAQYRFSSGGLLHTFTLNFLNLTDQEYYNHLSRIKDLFPEPGRSVNLLYRLYF